MNEKKKEPKEKPLGKMTVKELREIAKEMPEITGVHGQNKAELFNAISEVSGITDKSPKKKGFYCPGNQTKDSGNKNQAHGSD